MSAPGMTDHTAMNASEAEVMSTPVPWDYDTAVRRIRQTFEKLGGRAYLKSGLSYDHIRMNKRNPLRNKNVRMRAVLVREYYQALQHDVADMEIKRSVVVKEMIAMRAKDEPECWQAMVNIETIEMSGKRKKAVRKVKRTIGDCPRKSSGRPSIPNEARNEFIHDCIEYLTVSIVGPHMKKNDAIDIVSKAMQCECPEISKETVWNAIRRHDRMIDADCWLFEKAYVTVGYRVTGCSFFREWMDSYAST